MGATRKSILASRKIWFFLLPSLVGMAAFYFAPTLYSLFYAFTDNGSFVWFRNFIDTLSNSVFQSAAKNTLMFMAVCVPLNMILSFWLAGLMQGLKQKKTLAVAFMLPLVIPSGSVVFFWKSIFDDNGLINRILFSRGLETTYWFASPFAFAIVIIVFLFKNIGFNLVLFMAGYQLIPKHYYEVAEIEGARRFRTFRKVTFVYMLPTTFLVLMMSIINSFKIFREIYLLFGQYPYHSIYMLQHYMNNQFAAANLQRLSTSATILSVGVMLLVLVFFSVQRRISDTYS